MVDSILQEASALSDDPCTPESHSTTFTIAQDPDLMTGGGEGGVPHGRMHHADRVKDFHLHHEEKIKLEDITPVRIPGSFEKDAFATDEPSFSSISLSTPPKQKASAIEVEAERPSSVPIRLPPDTEVDEVGLPLGRSHHADRSRLAHELENDPVIEDDVRMLPGSPSPPRRYGSIAKKPQPIDSFMPKLDFGLSFSVDNSKSFVDGLL